MAEKELIFRIVPEYDSAAGREAFDSFTRAAAEAHEKINRLGRFGPAGFSGGGGAMPASGGTFTAPVHGDAIRAVQSHADAYRRLGEEAHRAHTSIVTQAQHVTHGLHKTLRGVEQLARGITLLGLSGEADLGKLVHKLAQFEGIVATLKGVSSIGSGLRRSGLMGAGGFLTAPMFGEAAGAAAGAAVNPWAAGMARMASSRPPTVDPWAAGMANIAAQNSSLAASGVVGAGGSSAGPAITAVGSLGEVAGVVGVILLVGAAMKVMAENLQSLNNHLGGFKDNVQGSAEDPHSFTSMIGEGEAAFGGGFNRAVARSGLGRYAGIAKRFQESQLGGWLGPAGIILNQTSADSGEQQLKNERMAARFAKSQEARQLTEQLDREIEAQDHKSFSLRIGVASRRGDVSALRGMMDANNLERATLGSDQHAIQANITKQYEIQEALIKTISNNEEKRLRIAEAEIAKGKERLSQLQSIHSAQVDVNTSIERSMLSAKERFGAMSTQEQAAAKRVFAKAQSGKPLNRREAGILSQIPTQAAEQLAAGAYRALADRGGYDSAGFDYQEQYARAEGLEGARSLEGSVNIQRNIVLNLENDNKKAIDEVKKLIEPLEKSNDELAQRIIDIVREALAGKRKAAEDIAKQSGANAASGGTWY